MDRVMPGLVLAALLAGSASAEMLGLASSYNSYTITRADSSLQAPAQSSSAIQPGDRLAAGDARVKLETLTGQTVLLGENSEATVGASAFELHRGEVSMSLTPSDKDVRTVSYGGLQILAAEKASDDVASLVAVKALSENELQVNSQGREVSVLDANGKTVATVKSRQAVLLARKDGVWSPATLATAPGSASTSEVSAPTAADARYSGATSAVPGARDTKDLGNGTFRVNRDGQKESGSKSNLYGTAGTDSQKARRPGSGV